MLASIPRLEDYEVSPYNGFLPTELPLEVLPDPYYARWETIIKNLQGLILSRRLRDVIERLPVLGTDALRTEAEWRRAYSILAFLSHAYIWGGDVPLEVSTTRKRCFSGDTANSSQVVPPTISTPFLATCRHLDLPPVATYAAVVLFNFKPLFDDEPIDNLENLSTLTTFTGSLDESWFYLVSVAIEARAGPVIPIMLDAIQAARENDSRHVTACLQSFAETIDELGTLLVRMYENCDSHVFYHRIRPFLAGSKNMADAGLPNGVLFDDNSGTFEYVQYSGGSNAQSSIIQFFDIVLGVEHLPTGSQKTSSTPASDSEGSSPKPPSHNFIHDMRRYMPGPHRQFLRRMEEVANIRDFVENNRSDKALCTAYDACLAMLRGFRDKHVQMVSRYIIIKSRESRSDSHSRSLSPRQAVPQRINLANNKRRDDSDAERKKNLKGTGGTALIPFLKQARDETGEPAIGSWARRLLTNGPGAALALGGVDEHKNGQVEIVGLAGIWSVDDSDGGICHW